MTWDEAIGHAAILQGHKVIYRETHVLLEELGDASVDGSRKRYMENISSVALLIIDPFIASVAAIGFGASYGAISWLFRSRLKTNSECIAEKQTQLLKALQDESDERMQGAPERSSYDDFERRLKERLESLLRAFDLELREDPAGADATAHEHRGGRRHGARAAPRPGHGSRRRP
mgnify:CR=1 FL=1